MPAILSFVDTTDVADEAQRLTLALATTLRLRAEQRDMPSDGDVAATVLHLVDDPAVALAVLPYTAGDLPPHVVEIIGRCPHPMVLVPVGRRVTAPELISRVLVPLDGTPKSAATVAGVLALFSASGTDIVALHVFDGATVPKFWDQHAHARKSWDEEFLARNCNEPDARLELRTGEPGESILDVAAAEHADLIALGWAQKLSDGRARTVRTTLVGASTPILLLPVAGAHGAGRRDEPIPGRGVDA